MKPSVAAELFDQAAHDPTRREDAVSALFTGLAAAAQAAADERRRRREEARAARRNRPEAVAARQAAAAKGWETRRCREAEGAARDGWDDRPVRTGPVCDEMNHNSVGREVFCELEPDHEEDHDDGDGTTWPRED
ncbi:hypothetical protein Shyhy01_74160 [Streptomyces hygroscopicus subsp. hygroscopicus]|uniref:hypothetical protein n=1 Tax=Streptomyces sp. KHY 26 TaxID=3097359 RepID=UPI0024A19699|nr:hypothetical protein [Streptomyces hygroscopicus]GLX54467.1 hypothetical protein Shyhy01_74160 [Streptomyces hygroscopicus subsp. hygroscopicus]